MSDRGKWTKFNRNFKKGKQLVLYGVKKYYVCFSQPNYLLTQRSRVLLEKLTGFQLVKKFPAFYGTRRFIIAFPRARQLSLSWASTIQSVPPHPTSWRPILILSSHLRLGLPSGLFLSGFLTKTLYTPLFSPYVLHAPLISLFQDCRPKSIILPVVRLFTGGVT